MSDQHWFVTRESSLDVHQTMFEGQSETIKIPAADVTAFAQRLLIAAGAPEATASIVSKCLVAADLRGVESHGINRLPSYLGRVRAGILDAKAQPTLVNLTPAVAQVDGQNGFGFAAASLAMQRACEMASEIGIGMVSVKHSNHFGMSAWIAQQAIDAGYMSLVFTNSSPALPPFGGKTPLLGVSPICCGAPGGTNMGKPFILDMAPSVAARGKIHRALRRNEQIPEGWALDNEGHDTTDPSEALEGVMLPLGGPKGSGLAIFMDIWSGVFSGAGFGGQVEGPYEQSRISNVGHFLIAIKPDLFMSLEEFRQRMDYLYQKVVESPKAPGVDRIYFPGEMEHVMEAERLATGIPYHINEVEALDEEARRYLVEEIRSNQRSFIG